MAAEEIDREVARAVAPVPRDRCACCGDPQQGHDRPGRLHPFTPGDGAQGEGTGGWGDQLDRAR